MAYHGELLDSCGVLEVDLRVVSIVAVTGAGPNVCGHLLLFAPSRGGLYFHVSGLHGYPRYMTTAGYHRYLREHGKNELRRVSLHLPKPRQAEVALERLLAGRWAWWVLPHNCVRFCEEIIEAGGHTWASSSNCPVLATNFVEEAVGQFLSGLESSIYQRYGHSR